MISRDSLVPNPQADAPCSARLTASSGGLGVARPTPRGDLDACRFPLLVPGPQALPGHKGGGQAARAAGMPLGGGLRSSQTGLDVAMIAPVEEMTWARRKLSCVVETAWVIWPLTSCAGV